MNVTARRRRVKNMVSAGRKGRRMTSDLQRALDWLDDWPHLAAQAVVLSAEIDHLVLLAEHGSQAQMAEQAARVKAASFPESVELIPVPGRSVMVDAVAIKSPPGPGCAVPAVSAGRDSIDRGP